jgi:hypothetical protein
VDKIFFLEKMMVQAENLLATVRPLLATLWQHFKSVACLKATLASQKKTSLRPAKKIKNSRKNTSD